MHPPSPQRGLDVEGFSCDGHNNSSETSNCLYFRHVLVVLRIGTPITSKIESKNVDHGIVKSTFFRMSLLREKYSVLAEDSKEFKGKKEKPIHPGNISHQEPQSYRSPTERFQDIFRFRFDVNDPEFSTRVGTNFLALFGILGGILSILVPIYNFMRVNAGEKHVETQFQLVNDVYLIVFGLIILYLNFSELSCMPSRLRNGIISWFGILASLLGRGTFYIFVGNFFVAKGYRLFENFFTGIYLILLGLVCFYILAKYGDVLEFPSFDEEAEMNKTPRLRNFICNLPTCNRIASRFQCPQCFKNKQKARLTYYCEQAHFKQDWKRHCKELHHE